MPFGDNLLDFPHQIPLLLPALEGINPFFDPCPFRETLPVAYLYS